MDIADLLSGGQAANVQEFLDTSVAVTGETPTQLKDPSHTLPTEPLTEIQQAKLLDPTATFTYKNGEIDRTIKMQDVYDQINSKGTINLEDATEAALRFEGFQEAMPLGGFTILPSKVGVVEATNWMKERLDGRLELQTQEMSDFIANPFVGAINTTQEFYDGEGRFLKEQISDFCGKLRTQAFKGKRESFLKVRCLFGQEIEDGSGEDGLLLPMTIPLLDSQLKEVRFPSELIAMAFRNLVTLASDPYMAQIVAYLDKDSFYHPADKKDGVTVNVPITVLTFLSLMAWGEIPGYVQYLEEQAVAACAILEKIVPELPATPVDFKAYRDFRVRFSPEIEYATDCLHFYPELLGKLRNLQMNLEVICDEIPGNTAT